MKFLSLDGLTHLCAELDRRVNELIGAVRKDRAFIAPIAAEVYNHQLYIRGAKFYLDQGYVPYVFRLIRKRNQFNPNNYPQKFIELHGPNKPRKGWCMFGCSDAVHIDSDNLFSFTLAPHQFIADRDKLSGYDFSPLPDALVHINPEYDTIAWGRSTIGTVKETEGNYLRGRLIKLRFAIAFGKPCQQWKKISIADMESPLAQFSVLHVPTIGLVFGKH